MGDHARRFGRNQTACAPWHYVPVIACKPGALRNGDPFTDWVLPVAIERMRRKLAGSPDGDQQMVESEAEIVAGLATADSVEGLVLRRCSTPATIALQIRSALKETGPKTGPNLLV